MVMTGEQIQYAVIAIVFIAMVIIVVRNFKKKKNVGCSSCPYSCGCLKYNELNNKNKIKNGKPKKT